MIEQHDQPGQDLVTKALSNPDSRLSKRTIVQLMKGIFSAGEKATEPPSPEAVTRAAYGVRYEKTPPKDPEYIWTPPFQDYKPAKQASRDDVTDYLAEVRDNQERYVNDAALDAEIVDGEKYAEFKLDEIKNEVNKIAKTDMHAAADFLAQRMSGRDIPNAIRPNLRNLLLDLRARSGIYETKRPSMVGDELAEVAEQIDTREQQWEADVNALSYTQTPERFGKMSIQEGVDFVRFKSLTPNQRERIIEICSVDDINTLKTIDQKVYYEWSDYKNKEWFKKNIPS